MISKYLTEDVIHHGLEVLGVNPIIFYKRLNTNSSLAVKKVDLISAHLNLRKPTEGESYFDVWVENLGLEAANYLVNLPAIINYNIQNYSPSYVPDLGE